MARLVNTELSVWVSIAGSGLSSRNLSLTIKNGTNAAIRAGYTTKSARITAAKLLAIANIQDAIAEAEDIKAKVGTITIERVLEEYRRLAYASVVDMVTVKGSWVYIKDTDDLSIEQQAAISEIQQTKDGVRVKFHDKTKALESLARYLGMFNDKLKIEHEGLQPIIQLIKAESVNVELPQEPLAIEGEVIDVESDTELE